MDELEIHCIYHNYMREFLPISPMHVIGKKELSEFLPSERNRAISENYVAIQEQVIGEFFLKQNLPCISYSALYLIGNS